MSKRITLPHRPARLQAGFTMIELMVTLLITLFLLGGLFTIVQNMRKTYTNQQALAQLQDQQRFAMTVLTDVIQAGGYFPNPVTQQPITALPIYGASFVAGQAFFGTHAAGNPDTLSVRYNTAINDGVILCDGSTNTANGPTAYYLNAFTVVPPAGNVPGQLQCALTTNGGAANAAVTLVNGVQNLLVYYGVKRNAVPVDYNVDTYLTADQMNAGNGDWNNVSAVRVVLTFTNPLAGQPGQPATIQFERVVEVMGRAGPHT